MLTARPRSRSRQLAPQGGSICAFPRHGEHVEWARALSARVNRERGRTPKTFIVVETDGAAPELDVTNLGEVHQDQVLDYVKRHTGATPR